MTEPDTTRQFTSLYERHHRQVYGYAVTRAGRDLADEVVAETFLVAWRRLDEVPAGAGARLWLFAVARRVIANLHRTERRRTRLAARLGESLRTQLATWPPAAGEAAEVLRAIGELGEDDRELLLLVSWEELAPGEAAKVLGISGLAARSRLHRARRRLRDLLEDREAAGAGPELDMEEAR